MQFPPPAPVRCAQRVLCACLALSFGATLAQPAGRTDLHGTAQVTQQGATTTIQTFNGPQTRHSAFDWRSFDVQKGNTVNVLQPDALSTSINRVTGKDPSAIHGTLWSNGRLVLVNPAGIAVGSGAVVDTAGFTASTLFMSRDDAVAGRLRFALAGDSRKDDDDDGDKAGTLKIEGRVLARNGDVVLIGPRIETGAAAVIEASGGDVILAAGRKVEITGRGLEGIRMEVRAPDDSAVNLGTLKGDSVAIFAGQLRHSGLIQARSATVSGGRVVLQGIEQVEVNGRIEAANAERGGSVHITADELVLKKTAFIDVRHLSGGGEMLVGGGRRGGDARLQNAQEVEVEQGVQLRADATLSGAGGTVVVWSERKTDFRGEISARGSEGQPGGYVEVASRGELRFRGKVDVGSGAPDAPAPSRDRGKSFPAHMTVAMIPRSEQPIEVQLAIAEPDRDTAQALVQMAWVEPLASGQKDPYQRKVVVTALQCVTR